AGRLTGLRLQTAIQLARIACQLRHIDALAQLADETGRVPGRAAGQLFAFQQNDVAPTYFGEVISDRTADHTAAHDHDPRVFWEIRSHWLHPHPRVVRIESGGAQHRRRTALALDEHLEAA